MIEKKVPSFIAEKLGGASIKTVKFLLRLNVMVTKKYTNKRYYEEIKGIAKGSGVAAL
jgi:hypothetical protein